MRNKSIKKIRFLFGSYKHFVPLFILALSFSNSSIINISYANEWDKAMLKALYSYKFGKFTQWPDKKLNRNSESFQYCILGENPFSQSTLQLIADKTVQKTPLSLKIFDSGLVAEEVLNTCHIVFISHSEKYRLSTILFRLKQSPILTISDISGFSAQGGMVTLIEEQGKLRFQINPVALQQANMSISSKIMELADIVSHEP